MAADTVPGGLITTVSVPVNGVISGEIDYSNDWDMYRVDLVAGHAYRFEMKGVATGNGTLANPWLELVNPSGTYVAFNDDSGGTTNAAISFVATQTGTHYLEASAYDYFQTGTFLLSAAEATGVTHVVYTGTFSGGGALKYRFSSTYTETFKVTTTGDIQATALIAGDDSVSGTWMFRADYISLAQLVPANSTNGTILGSGSISGSQSNVSFFQTDGELTVSFTATIDDAGNFTPGTIKATLAGHTGVLIIGTDDGNVLIGGLGDDTVVGNGGDDTLKGGGGNDVLDGGVGDNDLQGEAGTDIALLPGAIGDYEISILSPGAPGQSFYDPGFGLQPGDVVNLVNESGRIDRLVGVEKVRFVGNPESESDDVEFNVAGASLLQSAAVRFGEHYLADSLVANSLSGGAGNDVLDGLGGADTLLGMAGNDVLIGGAGNDSLIGGAGNDRYIIDSAGDQIVELADGGSADRVQTALSQHSLADAPEVEVLEFTGTGAFHGTGNARNNTLIGKAGADTLEGDAGNDTLLGAGGNDVLIGGAGNDRLDGGTGNDLIVLSGDHDDCIAVQQLEYVLVGHVGVAERDRVVNVERVRFADGWEGTLADLFANTIGIDYTISGGTGDDVVTGSLGFDRITGLEGDDTLEGGAGGDTLWGGPGNDVLVGGVDDDLLDGGTGIDVAVLAGNPGDYTFQQMPGFVRIVHTPTGEVDHAVNVERARFADSSESVLPVAAAGGAASSADDTLVGGAGNDALSGLAGNDRLEGLGGNDTLDGGTGADTLIGGAGNDRFLVDSVGDVVADTSGNDTVEAGVSFVLPVLVENLTLTGSANINATGNALANLITGNEGDNRLDGGAGADTLIGAEGNDTYVVDSQADVLVDSGGASDTVIAFAPYSFTSNAEIENGSAAVGTASINLTGNAGANILTGNAGANVLDGGAGNDTLSGGRGDDTYVVDSAGDVLVELSGQGRDTIVTPFSTVLASPFENLSLSGASSVNATGNAAGNLLQGNAGNNVLDGGGGLDTMEGGAGNDSYVIDRLLEQGLIGDSGGIDTVVSSANYTGLQAGLENLTLAAKAWIGLGNDTANVITGTVRANILIGGGGNDTLIGGGGADLLDGGLGADRFVFDTALGTNNLDFIVDFSAAQGDRIVLDNDIFIALGAPHTLLAAEFRAAPGATAGADASDRIVLDTASGALYYDADGNGIAAAVRIGTLGSSAGVGAANFEVVD